MILNREKAFDKNIRDFKLKWILVFRIYILNSNSWFNLKNNLLNNNIIYF